ncbi:MAG: hypothetical protein K8R21_09350, partial [Leptospira sp.]|nr:hypothetical protein [Leptospira sp.]
LEIKDGRKFHCSSVEIENNKIRLNSEFLKISIPVSMLKQISLTGGTENSRKEERIKLEFNSGEEMRARALKHSGTSFIILRNGEEKEISESQLKRISF